MTTGAARSPAPAVWPGLAAGLLAWMVDQFVSYALVPWSCASGRHAPLHGISLLCLLLVAAGSVLAWRAWRSEGDRRHRFLGLAGLLLCLMFGLVTAFDVAAKLMLDPCLH